MLLQATGTIDSASMPSQVAGGEASGAGLSMALSGLMKKNKRTLINFQEDFLMPFINKAAWRFMQFDPERYPVQDFNFIPVSTMGMVAREYEQQQMMGLMSTLGAQSPITPVLLQGIIASSSMSNREEIIATLQEMSQPSPDQVQLDNAMKQLQFQTAQAMLQKTQAEASKAMAEAELTAAKTQIIPVETQIKAIEAQAKASTDSASSDFEKQIKLTDQAIKIEDIKSNERIAAMQMENKKAQKQADEEFKQQFMQ
jgi:hypothetical protein